MMVHFISDSHFNHENILRFNQHRAHMGTTIDEMNEYMIEAWNSVVKKEDIVYHLGDFAFKTGQEYEKVVKIGERLNGFKVLVLGNHDRYIHRKYPNRYKEFGFDVVEDRVLEMDTSFGMLILSHEPVAKFSWESNCYNIHGHLHDKVVVTGEKPNMAHDDPIPLEESWKYVNVSVEQLDGAKPVGLYQLQEIIEARMGL